MKIEKLTDNKIRIVLNIDELTEKNIDFLSLTKHTDETQKLYKKILKRAEKEVGFHSEDCKLLIEAFISSDGFFVITFTKLMPSEDTPIGMPCKLKIKKKPKSSIINCFAYEFDTFDDFSTFCTYIKNSNINDISDFSKKISFYQYKQKYYLLFFNLNNNYKNQPFFYNVISEFAKLASNSAIFTSKILECGNPIFKNNALENGINFFKTL